MQDSATGQGLFFFLAQRGSRFCEEEGLTENPTCRSKKGSNHRNFQNSSEPIKI